MSRRKISASVLATGWLLAAGGGVLVLAGPAHADLTTDTADCQGEVVVTGDNGTDTTITQDTDQATVDRPARTPGPGASTAGRARRSGPTPGR